MYYWFWVTDYVVVTDYVIITSTNQSIAPPVIAKVAHTDQLPSFPAYQPSLPQYYTVPINPAPPPVILMVRTMLWAPVQAVHALSQSMPDSFRACMP